MDMKNASALKSAKGWLRGFGLRLWFSAKVIAVCPMLLALFLASPFWWLLTGKPVDPPSWLCRIMDGHGY
jgi:hypothetical protein